MRRLAYAYLRRRDLHIRSVGCELQVRQEIAVKCKGVACGKGRFEQAGSAARTKSIVEADTHDIVAIVTWRRGEAQAQGIGDRRNLSRRRWL